MRQDTSYVYNIPVCTESQDDIQLNEISRLMVLYSTEVKTNEHGFAVDSYSCKAIPLSNTSSPDSRVRDGIRLIEVFP